MKTRIITAAVALAVFAPILYFSAEEPYKWIFPIFAALMGLVSSFEIVRCCTLDKRYVISVPAVLIFTLIPLGTRLFNNESEYLKTVILVFMLFVFYVFACSVFSHGKAPISDCCTALTVSAYACAGFCALVFMRDLPGGAAFMFPLIFMGAWITDTGAYFAGVAFGKHKLIPDVSPKKTVEGALGGIALTVISFAVYSLVICRIYNYHTNYLAVAILAVITAIISMIGDLIASLVKRHYGIKDYGKLFPGHGGVMDRFDSIIATSISLYTLVKISDFFVIFK